jgi:glycosyltransferase involved in cell wall biosynthesis
MASLVRSLFASVWMPPGAAAVMVGSGAALALGLASLAHAVSRPIDVSWLYAVAFVLVFGLHLSPVLAYGLCALGRPRSFPPHPPRVRFLCLVPARNEERVIQNSVASLLGQSYPSDLYEVYVISDGSTDGTDDRARALGARVLRTRSDGRGKASALGDAFARLLRGDEDPRYVCVVDADNRVDPAFLQEMNNAICATGARCLQAFQDCLNGADNWITKAVWVTTAASARLYHPGRARSLGTALVCGSGWCCQAGLVRRYWPMIRTQTEDIEFTGLLLLHEGTGVSWVHAARVYDEKPQNLWVAIRQRRRWMTGHMRVARHLFWPCLREGIRRRDLRLVDLAVYYLLPFALNLGTVQVVLLAGMRLGLLAVHGPLAAPAAGWCINVLVALYVFGYQIYGFGRETGLWARGALYSLYAAIATFLTWTPALVWACFTLPRRDWIFHTPHIAAAEPRGAGRGPRGREAMRASS